MANRARRWHYAESLTTSTNATTTDSTKVTLTHTPDASSTYVYMWSCDVNCNAVTVDTIVKLKNNAGTAICTTNWEAKDTTDWNTLSGMAFITYGASPTSQNIILTFANESTLTSSIRNARIVAIKLTSADVYTENTADQSTTLASLQTALTLSFTPATTGSYLILGYCESRSSVATVTVNTQITHNSVGYNVAASRPNDITNYCASLMQASVGSLSNTSQSVTLQFSSGTAGSTVNCRNAKLLALRLDEFTTSDITTDASPSTTSSITYTTKTTTGAITTYPMSYLIVGTASISGNSTTISSGFGLSVDGTYVSESLLESSQVGFLAPGIFGAIDVVTAGSSLTANFNYYAETASAAATADDVTISVLLLDPTDLYWVGGTGTWNSTSATNWSLTSGGTGGVAAPKAGTNVNFDSNSDSGAGFTVTVSTGATCGDMTASGLDQLMTLSGTAAWSVYGNFSIPATNFTQSYTGTITFAAISSKTITTNGKSFTAATFDGVGGTWTLQDAFTLSGAGILTNGTLALSSYTLTALTFASNNSNVRTINFGTGKIVVTAATTTTVWTTSTITNLTILGTPLVELTGGGATTKTITAGSLADGNSISFLLSTTAGTVTLSGSVRDLTFANNTFTFTNVAFTMHGSLTINGTSPTLSGGTNTLTFAGSGTQNITTNGKVLDFPIVFSGTGTYALQSALQISAGSVLRNIGFNSGTLELNSYTMTTYSQISSGSGSVRRIQMSGTGGKIVNTVGSGTVINFSNTTNFTTDGNVLIQSVGTVAGTARAMNLGSLPESDAISYQSSDTAGSTTLSSTVKNLIIDDTAHTFNNTVLTIYGDLYIAGTTNVTVAAGASGWTFGATSGTQNITTNGEILDLPITFGSGASSAVFSLQDALSVGTTSRAVIHNSGTIDLNSYTFTILGTFTSSNSNSRRLQMSGTGGKFVLPLATATTVWSTSTITNLTTDGKVLVQLTGGGATTKTIVAGALSEANSISFQLSNSAGTVTFTASDTVKNLTIDNTSFTLANIAITIYGNLTINGTTPTLTAGTNAWTLAGSGTQLITSSGETIDWPITLSGTGTYSLQDAMIIGTSTSRTLTHTSGTIELNSYTLTLFGVFSSAGTSTRRIQMSGAGGKIVLSLNTTTTIWDTSTVTGLTTDGNVLVQSTGGGATTKTISAGTLSEANSFSFQFSNTAGTATLVASNTVKNLTIDNNSFTFSNVALTIYGSLTIGGTTVTLTAGTNTWTFAATSSGKTITTNGEPIDWPITFNGVGGAWQLLDSLTVAATKIVTLTAGTLNLNSLTHTVELFAVTGTGAKVLAHGTNGKLTVTGSGATAFNATGSNLTSTGTGAISMTSASAKTFVGGGNSYNTLEQGGAGDLTITGSNTFKDITNTVSPCAVYFTSGTTNTFTVAFSLSGISAGSLVTIGSTSTSAHTLNKTFGTDVIVNYCLISYSTVNATGWYALNSIDFGNNTFWQFTLLKTGNMILMFY